MVVAMDGRAKKARSLPLPPQTLIAFFVRYPRKMQQRLQKALGYLAIIDLVLYYAWYGGMYVLVAMCLLKHHYFLASVCVLLLQQLRLVYYVLKQIPHPTSGNLSTTEFTSTVCQGCATTGLLVPFCIYCVLMHTTS